MSESCNSRHLSWLMKSCFPNNPPKHTVPSHQPISESRTSISALPDELLLECLSRVPPSSLPCLPLVCSRWSHLLDSPTFHLLRLRHNLLRLTLFAFSFTSDHFAPTLYSARLASNVNGPTSWKLCSFRDPTLLQSLSHSPPLSAIGRRIYVIGRTLMLRCDTWTGTVVPRQGPIFLRRKFAAAAVAGKIYVAGGCAAAVEEYDPTTNTWRVVAHALRKRYGCVGASVDGVFYIIGGLKIGGGNDGAVVARADVYASSMDLYDVGNGVWLRSRAVPGGGCVVAACAAAEHIFVLSSHAVELSFWRFNGSRRKCNGSFGEWCRIKPPPLPAQVRLDSRVRFSCVGIGGDKVVLIQQAVNRRMERGLVWVYDCATGEWSQGAHLPELIRRAACVCAEC